MALCVRAVRSRAGPREARQRLQLHGGGTLGITIGLAHGIRLQSQLCIPRSQFSNATRLQCTTKIDDKDPEETTKEKDWRKQYPKDSWLLKMLILLNLAVFGAWRIAIDVTTQFVEEETKGESEEAVQLAIEKASQEGLLGFMLKNFIFRVNDIQEGRPWTIVTSMFSHTDLQHLAGNMGFLIIFFKGLHAFIGPTRFIVLYLSAGAAGQIASMVHNQHAEWVYRNGSLGASGSLMGVMAAYLFLFPTRRIHFSRMAFFLEKGMKFLGLKQASIIKRLKIPTAVLVPFYPISDSYGLLAQVEYQKKRTSMDQSEKAQPPAKLESTEEDAPDTTQQESPVGHACHIGGFLCGVMFFIVRYRGLRTQSMRAVLKSVGAAQLKTP